jgi:uncharacterized small protein (DUF1192 family)
LEVLLPVVHWLNGISRFTAELNLVCVGPNARQTGQIGGIARWRKALQIRCPVSQKADERPLSAPLWPQQPPVGGAMATEDDDRPRKKISHEIGQDLSLLSVEELTERIALLTGEIERMQAAAARKRASKEAANSIFKS